MQTGSWVLHSWLSSSQNIYRECYKNGKRLWEEVEQG